MPQLIKGYVRLVDRISDYVGYLAASLIFFMGATLPVLIAHLVRVWHNVGAATGHLYALNTLGAMLGCSLAAFWLFNRIELDQAIQLAAAINFTVAAVVGASFKGATK